MRKLIFGYGKILMTPEFRPSIEEGRLNLQEGKGTGMVGEHIDSSGFKRTENDVVLCFANIESLDALIERLQTTKRMMLGTEKNLREFIEDVED